MTGRKSFSAVRLALLAGVTAGGFGAAPLMAQEAQAGEDQGQAIVITGSRIVRRDYQANSPIVTVDDSLLRDTSNTGLEESLNKLPQFTPAQNPRAGGDIQPSATNTPGAATVSLRAIGANRNLVLVDGRRPTPSNATLSVDLNTIPASAIERIEIITGGASATYGADAVGGVVNLILKKRFQGLEVDGQYGISQYGDQDEYRLAATVGTNFEDGRGNIMMALEVNDRSKAMQVDRPWFNGLMNNPDSGGNLTSLREAALVPGNFRPSQASVTSALTVGGVAPNPVVTNTQTIYFNADGSGTAFGGATYATRGGLQAYTGPYGIEYKKTVAGTLVENWLGVPLVVPLNRWNMYSRAEYEIADWLTFVGQGYFSRTETRTDQIPAGSFSFWSTTIPVDGREQAYPELAAMLASRTVAAGTTAQTLADYHCPAGTVIGGSAARCDWQLQSYVDTNLQRTVLSQVMTFQAQAGLEGKIPGTEWTWDATASHGEATTNSTLLGFFSLDRYRTIIAAPNWGKNFYGQGNELFGGSASAAAICTSGLNPFDTAPPSQDCVEAVSADLKHRQTIKQGVYEFNIQGPLFKLPAGDLRVALGASHRKEDFQYLADTLTSQGRSFLDQAIGQYPTGNTIASINVTEFYGEALVPVLADVPLVKKLELELGARSSDYNATGVSVTWKALGDWQVTDWLRFRGGFNKAERAPNIAELYQAPQQSFATTAGGDFCSTANPLPWTANPTSNKVNAAQVRAVCEAMLNRFDPNTATEFYGSAASTATATSGTQFLTSIGNANVQPETAKTWTFGAVVSAPLDSPWLRTLRLSVDYYNIKVTNAISSEDGQIIQQKCFDPAYNPGGISATSAACLNITRNPGNGAIANLVGVYTNKGAFTTSGIDAQLDWRVDPKDVGIGIPGTFGVTTQFTYLVEQKTTADATAATPVWNDYVGTLGTNQNGLTFGAYRWSMLNNYSYSVGKLRASLVWTHLPRTRNANANINVATGVRGTTTLFGAPTYDVFGLNLSYAATKIATIRFGVDNLFNRAPPLINYNTAPNRANGELTGGSFGSTGSRGAGFSYDTYGRRFYLGAKFKL
jgi:outer membrane receptor protein involved in Fe transport